MITVVGAFFWLIALAAVYRLVLVGPGTIRSRIIEIALLGLLAVLLLFRPHEDIFGGEDPGSYINSGISYNRQDRLFYIDELLARVPSETRPAFYYGHAGYGLTKDACLWIRNADLAMVGPHFQPAYPLLIAGAVNTGFNSGALFVVPLFALFAALALRALALLTIPYRWAGLVAFLVFVCNPLLVWHGRCARPEIIAAFMFFGGGALALQAWQNRSWRNWPDILIGAACLGAAPLFHITAWLLVIPAVTAITLAVIFKGRDDFLPFFPVVGLMVWIFYFQTKNVTDYYTVQRFLEPLFTRPLIIAAGLILLTALTLLVKRHLRPRSNPETKPAAPPSLLLCAILGIGLIAFLASLFFGRQIYGDLPILGRPVRNYLYLTDFKVVANMLSGPVMFLILAGLMAWLTGRATKRDYRVIAFIVLFPALMLTGNIGDFMMTRYLMVAVIPAAALFLAALVALILPRETGVWRPALLAALVCLIALNKRSHLITTTEHKGFARFLRPYAEIVNANHGILLCEYSRIAAPLEHFFGAPTLGLDNETRKNYDQAEKAWAGIMRSMPERAAYFATPYHEPLSEWFSFKPIYTASFPDCRLEQARQSLPAKVGKSELVLRLFQMKLKQPQEAVEDSPPQPTLIKPDAGNMGLRHFANMRNEPFSAKDMDFQPAATNLIALPQNLRQNAATLLAIPTDKPIQARWARAQARVLLPASSRHPSLLLIHFKAPDPEKKGFVSLQLTWNGSKLPAREIQPEKWQWQAWQLPALKTDSADDAAWLDIQTEPAWNPGKPNFPADLGILVSRIVVVPVK